MISQLGLLMNFLVEALNIVVHVLNFSPNASLEDYIPERVWTLTNVSYSHLRVFKCKSFFYTPKDEISNIEMKSWQCVFIDGRDEFMYIFYDPIEKNLVRSKDFVFMEDQTIYEILIDSKDSPSTLVHAEVEVEVQDDTPSAAAPAYDYVSGDLGEISATENQPTVVRSTERGIKLSTRYDFTEYELLTDRGETESYGEALVNEHMDMWRDEFF